MDVTRTASVDAAVDTAVTALGPLAVLCNNAGIAVTKPALEHSDEDWDRVLNTNLRGAFLVARAVGKKMVAQGQGGTIINTASVLSLRVAKHLAAYNASKGGLLQLTRSLAIELADHDIRVNAIAPGYIETEINRDFSAPTPASACSNASHNGASVNWKTWMAFCCCWRPTPAVI